MHSSHYSIRKRHCHIMSSKYNFTPVTTSIAGFASPFHKKIRIKPAACTTLTVAKRVTPEPPCSLCQPMSRFAPKILGSSPVSVSVWNYSVVSPVPLNLVLKLGVCQKWQAVWFFPGDSQGTFSQPQSICWPLISTVTCGAKSFSECR